MVNTNGDVKHNYICSLLKLIVTNVIIDLETDGNTFLSNPSAPGSHRCHQRLPQVSHPQQHLPEAKSLRHQHSPVCIRGRLGNQMVCKCKCMCARLCTCMYSIAPCASIHGMCAVLHAGVSRCDLGSYPAESGLHSYQMNRHRFGGTNITGNMFRWHMFTHMHACK